MANKIKKRSNFQVAVGSFGFPRVTYLPGFFIRLKTVVLRDPRVDLDAASLLLPEKTGHEGPGHLERVRCVYDLGKDLRGYIVTMMQEGGGVNQIYKIDKEVIAIEPSEA